MTEIPDDECAWWSTAIGPMRIEKFQDAWMLWRRILGSGDRFCGQYRNQAVAERMARILAELPDEKWL